MRSSILVLYFLPLSPSQCAGWVCLYLPSFKNKRPMERSPWVLKPFINRNQDVSSFRGYSYFFCLLFPPTGSPCIVNIRDFRGNISNYLLVNQFYLISVIIMYRTYAVGTKQHDFRRNTRSLDGLGEFFFCLYHQLLSNCVSPNVIRFKYILY